MTGCAIRLGHFRFYAPCLRWTLVTVIGVRGGQVRLGIDAPNDVAVDRQEVRARGAQFADIVPTPGTTPLLIDAR